jgi:hypothetical protein
MMWTFVIGNHRWLLLLLAFAVVVAGLLVPRKSKG